MDIKASDLKKEDENKIIEYIKEMKLTAIIAAAMVAIGFASCSDDALSTQLGLHKVRSIKIIRYI